MNQYTRRLFKLNSGLFFVALGIAMTIKAHIGYGPWEVFHAGLAQTFNISMGLASILDGLFIGVIIVLAGERIGIGTVLNMVMIGLWIDLIMPLLKEQQTFRDGFIFLAMGLFVISYGLYFYMSAGLGAGPCDSLMVAITRRTKRSIGSCRGSMEVLVVVLGWSLGGMIGPGTVISAIGLGFCIQTTFKLLKFDAVEIRHETIKDTYRLIKINKPR
ncbi:membrane protein [Gottschalkiaceae bacterium SANA]|nr:membrane protein [Gottschalkiaceae bacterium SANA]